MGYVEETLGSGESVEYVVAFHWLWSFFAYLFLMAGIFASIAILVLIPAGDAEAYSEVLLFYSPSLICLFAGLVLFLFMMIKKWTTERVLTDSRFIKKTGWIIRNTEDIRIDRMEEINLNQSILGRIFDYGDIRISGMGAGSIRLKMIDSPIDFQKSLNDLKFQYAQKASNP